MPLNRKGKKKLHTKRQHIAKKERKTKKIVRGHSAKSNVLLGKGRYDLKNNNKIDMMKGFSPIFDLNTKETRLDPTVLSSAIYKIIDKAVLYLRDGLHTIPLLNSTNKDSGKMKAHIGTNLSTIYTQDKINYFETVLFNIDDNQKKLQKNMTIAQFNIISLQLILLFTEILSYVYKFEKSPEQIKEEVYLNYLTGQTSMNTPALKINYEENYSNYSFLEKKVVSSDKFKYLIGKNGNLIPYENDIIHGMYIILFLGEIDVIDLTKAYINQIYLLGMTMEMEYADTNYVTPLSFLLHDMTHADNRIFNNKNADITAIMKNEKKFVNSIEKDELSKDDKYDIYSVLFLLIHETTNEHNLQKENINANNILDYQMKLIDLWAKHGVYNGLLPDNRKIGEYNLDELKTYIIPTIKDKDKHERMKKILTAYLNHIKDLFAKTWNECFAKKKESSID